MNYSRANFTCSERDRFIMSKGHSVPTQYVILSMIGIVDKKELPSIKQLGSCFPGHPDISKTPGIEAPTGSLGQGLSYANGIALGARLDDLKFNIYVVLGDGELQEGQVWEAAMTASHYGLTNVCVIIDRNQFQSQGKVDDMMGVEPLKNKWMAFGWHVMEIDGHDIKEICSALDQAEQHRSSPVAIIANTIKGKGISFIENTYKFHNYKLTLEEYEKAEKQIVSNLAEAEADGEMRR